MPENETPQRAVRNEDVKQHKALTAAMAIDAGVASITHDSLNDPEWREREKWE